MSRSPRSWNLHHPEHPPLLHPDHDPPHRPHGTAPVTALDGETLRELLTSSWDGAAPATWNRHLATLGSFIAYAVRRRWLETDPAAGLQRRKEIIDRTRSIPRPRCSGCSTCPAGSGAHASDRRHLPGHRAGPAVLPARGVPVQAGQPARDRFRPARLVPAPAPALPLTHLGASGRTAVELQAKSRHTSLRTLGRYVNPGPELAARVTAETEPRKTPPKLTTGAFALVARPSPAHGA